MVRQKIYRGELPSLSVVIATRQKIRRERKETGRTYIAFEVYNLFLQRCKGKSFGLVMVWTRDGLGPSLQERKSGI